MAANLSTTEPQGWHAELNLEFAKQLGRTVLAKRQHVGPLVVQRPFYPEGPVCHVYIVHPPGGIVGNDRLQLTAALQSGSHAVITTPAATKFYRSLPECRAQLTQSLFVHDAKLEWLPQETILFRAARAAMTTTVHLDRRSHFIGWELTCYGRPASNEVFDSGTLQQHFELWIDDQPVLLDHLHIDGASNTMNAPWGLAAHNTFGTLLAYPAAQEDLEAAREHESFACTLVDNALCCRLLSNDADNAKKQFIKLWQTLRPRIIGREAVAPRIWNT
jgi:urease accessory protein